jgi:hypothetical protein
MAQCDNLSDKELRKASLNIECGFYAVAGRSLTNKVCLKWSVLSVLGFSNDIY